MEKKGIDISYHQGSINFDELKGNIDFAMVRSSYGAFYVDSKFKTNIEGLEKINVPYGIYHFSYATNALQAKEEALKFIDLIKGYKPLYPVAIDIEASNVTKNLSKETLISIAKTFCETLEKNNYYAMIYANLDYFDNKLDSNSLNKYDKWLAQWSEKPTYTKSFGIWQYTSTGNVPGIKGNVDLDISYKDYPSIIKDKKLNNNEDNNNIDNSNDLVINYVVKKGDALSKIAKKYNTTVSEIAKLNNIKDPNKIYVNQVIKINQENIINPNTYIVKKGDTLSKIAKKYNTSWKKIYEDNKGIIGNNPNFIKPGITLKINV